MSQTKKLPKRSWPTTVISAILAAISLYCTIIIFRPDFAGITASIAIGAFTVLAILTTIEGKPKTLRWLAHSWLGLP